jgi:hypothetical protein
MATLQETAGSSKLGNAIRVSLPVSVAYDLEKLQKALANLARAGGHAGCTSGTDLTFLHVRDWVINPQTLQPQEVGTIGELK